MMGFGFLFMLVLVAFPIVGIVALAIWLYNANRQGTPFGQNQSPEKPGQADIPETKRVCSHCGAGLQEDWTHCPQCGASAGY
jgi:hypothetical protein